MQKPSTESKNKSAKEAYASPTIVDYGSVTKITATPKAISSPDGVDTKKGSCL